MCTLIVAGTTKTETVSYADDNEGYYYSGGNDGKPGKVPHEGDDEGGNL